MYTTEIVGISGRFMGRSPARRAAQTSAPASVGPKEESVLAYNREETEIVRPAPPEESAPQPPYRRPATLKEYLIYNLVMMAAIAVGLYVGLAAALLCVVVPACLALVAVRFRVWYTVGSVAICIALPSLLAMTLYLDVAFFAVPAALLMGLALRRHWGLTATLSLGAAGGLVSVLGLYLAGELLGSASPEYADLVGSFFEAMHTAIQQNAELAGMDSQVAELYYQTFVSMLPALLLCVLALFASLTFALVRPVLRRLDESYGYFRRLDMLHADRVSAIVFAVSALFSGFVGGVLGVVMVNVMILVSVLMMVCGLSVAVSFIRRLQSRVGQVLLTVLAFVLFLPMCYSFLLVGFLDAFFNLRRLGRGRPN